MPDASLYTFEQIKTYLTENMVPFETRHHEPTHTSEAAARVRGEDLAIGAKALVLRVHETFSLFVLSAALKVDSRKIRAYFQAKKTRFANPDELYRLTGLVPGSVPPFGRPILDIDLYVDPSVFRRPHIAFNAGSLTDSILIASRDYRRLATPTVFEFAKE